MSVFQLDPSLPFANFVNDKIAFAQRQGIAYQYNEILQSYPGDPQAGRVTPGTLIPWNETSETAGLIWEYFYATAVYQNRQNPIAALPADLEQILVANAGPRELWNYSYNDWGVVPGVAAAFKILNTVEVGGGNSVTVIVP